MLDARIKLWESAPNIPNTIGYNGGKKLINRMYSAAGEASVPHGEYSSAWSRYTASSPVRPTTLSLEVKEK